MNKQKIINEINKLNIDKNEFWVCGSASLVLRDLTISASDIDLAITKNAFNNLEKQTNIIYLGTNANHKWYKINDIVEFCIDEKTNEKVDMKEPFNLLNLNYYYNNFIKNSKRKKDIIKKELLEKVLFDKKDKD